MLPHRGRNIWSGDTWEDGGAFQFYGEAIDNIVADNIGERMSGFVSWGQWRGWFPANTSIDLHGASGLQGQMGNGLMINMRNTFLRNEFVGAFSNPNYNCSTGIDPFYTRRYFVTQPVSPPPGILGNMMLVFRQNTGGGGFSVGEGAGNMVIEGGRFQLDKWQQSVGECVLVAGGSPLVYVSNVTCSSIIPS